MTEQERQRFLKLSSSNVSDALDALGMTGSTYGVRPMWDGCPKIVGEAVTIKLGPTGYVGLQNTHLCVGAIASAKPGNVIVIDNGGDTVNSSWGGLLANNAKSKGIAGTVVDGVVRDVDDFVESNYPVFARGAVVRTSRGRVTEYEVNGMIQFAGTQVRPGDIVVGDRSGITFVPGECYLKVLEKAEELNSKESSMMEEVAEGKDIREVDKKYDYANLLKKK